eukprot:scaffold1669_cov99-Skeletonema_dohrnii-CCMP3373.AAC.11
MGVSMTIKVHLLASVRFPTPSLADTYPGLSGSGAPRRYNTLDQPTAKYWSIGSMIVLDGSEVLSSKEV